MNNKLVWGMCGIKKETIIMREIKNVNMTRRKRNRITIKMNNPIIDGGTIKKIRNNKRECIHNTLQK